MQKKTLFKSCSTCFAQTSSCSWMPRVTMLMSSQSRVGNRLKLGISNNFSLICSRPLVTHSNISFKKTRFSSIHIDMSIVSYWEARLGLDCVGWATGGACQYSAPWHGIWAIRWPCSPSYLRPACWRVDQLYYYIYQLLGLLFNQLQLWLHSAYINITKCIVTKTGMHT